MAQNEEVEIVGGNNDAVSCVVPITARKYDDHPEYHSLVAALSTKKYATLGKKKEVLLKFLPKNLDDVQKYWRDPDLYNHFFRLLLDHLDKHSKKDSDITKYLKSEFVAEALSKLFVLNEWNKALPLPTKTRNLRGSVRDDPSIKTKKAFVALTKFVGPIIEKYNVEVSQKQWKALKSKVNLQVHGHRVQDTVSFKPNYVDKDGCPACKHFYCQPTTTKEEIEQSQGEKDRAFDQRMTAWLAKPVKDRTGKPRKPQSVCMDFACFCTKLFCGFRDDGGDCPACTAAAAAGQSDLFIGGDGKSHCRCEICKCKCQIAFPVNNRRKVVIDLAERKRAMEGSSSGPPTDTPSYFNSLVANQIQQSTIDALQEPSFEVDPTMVHQNALSSAAMGLLSNTDLQSNMPLRNTMTQVMPRTTMTSTGLDINQLRRRHRMGLPITNQKPAAAAITPSSAVALTGAGREARFYRNGLSVEQLVPPSVAAAAARPFQSSISTLDDDDSDEIEIIEPKKKEDDRKPKAVESKSSTPKIVKRGRRRVNLTLREERQKSKEERDDEFIRKVKKTRKGLSSEKITKSDTEYFCDNEPTYKSSQDMLEDMIEHFNESDEED